MLNIFKTKLSKFDVHLKAADGVSQQTLFGSLLTVILSIIILFLIKSEISDYYKQDVVSRMKTDLASRTETVKIVYDIEFNNIKCDDLSFSLEITRGTLHLLEEQHIDKHPLENDGCRLVGDTITDKVGGTLKFQAQYTSHTPTIHQGFFEIIHIPTDTPNISHKINYIMFLSTDSVIAKETDIPGVHNPLNGQIITLPNTVGIYHYAIQVVSTSYINLKKQVSKANQYAVTERTVDVADAFMGFSVAQQSFKDFYGLLFTYDFYPVSLLLFKTLHNIIFGLIALG